MFRFHRMAESATLFCPAAHARRMCCPFVQAGRPSPFDRTPRTLSPRFCTSHRLSRSDPTHHAQVVVPSECCRACFFNEVHSSNSTRSPSHAYTPGSAPSTSFTHFVDTFAPSLEFQILLFPEWHSISGIHLHIAVPDTTPL